MKSVSTSQKEQIRFYTRSNKSYQYHQSAIACWTLKETCRPPWASAQSHSIWNLEMLIFEERGKPENADKNLSEQSKEPTTNLTHSWPEPGPRRWEASAITTTPSLLPITILSQVRALIGWHYKTWHNKFHNGGDTARPDLSKIRCEKRSSVIPCGDSFLEHLLSQSFYCRKTC